MAKLLIKESHKSIETKYKVWRVVAVADCCALAGILIANCCCWVFNPEWPYLKTFQEERQRKK